MKKKMKENKEEEEEKKKKERTRNNRYEINYKRDKQQLKMSPTKKVA